MNLINEQLTFTARGEILAASRKSPERPKMGLDNDCLIIVPPLLGKALLVFTDAQRCPALPGTHKTALLNPLVINWGHVTSFG